MAEDSERLLSKPRKTIKSEHIERISSLRKSKLKALKSIEKNYEKIVNLSKKMGHLETTNTTNGTKYLVDNANKQKKNTRPSLVKTSLTLDKPFQDYENSKTNSKLQTDQIILEWSSNRKRNVSRFTNESGHYDVRYKENFNKNVSEIINDVKHINPQEETNSSSSNASKFSNEVVVPSWRVVLFKANYKLEKTENLNDETYLKRHQKPETEEKQIKRWDLRRQREQYEREKLLKINSTANNVNSENDEDKLDENDDQLLIEIVDSKSGKDEKVNANTNTTLKKKTIVVKRLSGNKKPNANKNRYVEQENARKNSITNNNMNNSNKNVFKVYDFDIDSDSNDNIFVHTQH